MSEKLYGLYPPMITPFTKNGEVDRDAMENLLEFICDYVHGLFLCGSYGSGPLMSIDQRKKVLEYVIDRMPRDLKIIVHVGATSTDTSVTLAKHAEELGVYAVASVPPYYYKHEEKAVITHFRHLVTAVDIPVYAYNNPRTVGYPLTPDLLNKLKELGVSGVKDSSFDLLNYLNCKIVCGDDFDVVIGTESLLLPAYVLGARAFIPGLANHFPEIVKNLFDACVSGDWDKARELQFKVMVLRNITHEIGPSIVGVHAILKLRGVYSGYPKLPFELPEESVIEEAKRKIEDLGIKL